MSMPGWQGGNPDPTSPNQRGGLPARRPDQRYRPPVIGQAPGQQGPVVRARLVIVSGVGEGVFVYNGTPGPGNEPVLYFTNQGTDPFGNEVTPSLTLAGYPELVYSGPPALGDLIAAISGTAGTDAYGNTYPAGLQVGSSQTGWQLSFSGNGTAANPQADTTAIFPVTAGNAYSASAWLECSAAGTAGVALIIVWFSPAFASLGTASSPDVTATTPVQATATGTAPPGAAWASVIVQASGTPASSVVFYAAAAPVTGNQLPPAAFPAATSGAGAFLGEQDMAVADFTAASALWESWTGETIKVTRVYVAASTFTYTSDMAEMVAAGVKMCITLRPAYNPVSAADLANMTTLLQTLQAAGARCDITLWHEPYYSGLSAAQYIAMAGYYGPAVRQYFPLVFCTAVTSVTNNNENSYYPGDAWIDKIATDFYASGYINGQTLDLAASVANSAAPPKPFGVWEFNGSSDPVFGQTQAQVTAFFQYVQSYMHGRLSAGQANADVLLFNAVSGNWLGNGTSQNAGFEGGLGNWGLPTNCTLADSAAFAHSGADSMRMTAASAANMYAYCNLGATSGLPVVPGDQVTLSAWYLAGSTGRQTQNVVQWYNASGGFLSSSFSAPGTDVTTGWTQTVYSPTAPASAAFAIPGAGVLVPANGEIHYVDDVSLTLSTGSANVNCIEFPWDYRLSLWEAVYGLLTAGWSFENGAAGRVLSQWIPVSQVGSSNVQIIPAQDSPFTITTLISGILQAVVAMNTTDASQVLPGLLGSLLLGSGLSTQMATALTSPLGAGSGAALMLEAQSDGLTGTPVITLSSYTTPDGSTIATSPIAAFVPYGLVLYGSGSVQVIVTKTSGSGTIPIPAGVSAGKGEAWGAGHAGGGLGGTFASGGGGAGEYAQEPALALTPGGTAAYSAPAASSSSAATLAGSAVTVTANSGGAPTTTTGGPGGTGSTNTIHEPGGAGGDADVLSGSGGGGGGGGSGGASSPGNPGSPGTAAAGGDGAAAVAQSGPGGKGGNPGGNGAAPASGPGGGGGGAGGVPSGTTTGGGGRGGQVRLTYQTAVPVVAASITAASFTDQYGNVIPAGFAYAGPDGNVYSGGPVVVKTTGTQTIVSTGQTAIAGLSVPVVSGGTYGFRAVLYFIETGANHAYLSMGGPTTSSFTANGTYLGGVLGTGGMSGAFQQTAIGTNTPCESPALVANGVYVCTIEGEATFTASGNLIVDGAASAAATTFQTQAGCLLEVWPLQSSA